MLIDKKALKNIIGEEIERSFDQNQEGFVAADEAIEKFNLLTESQQINFLEKFINHINNKNIIK